MALPKDKPTGIKFNLAINCDNDAFFGDAIEGEVVRILQELRERMMSGDADAGESYNLRDMNGNTVGRAYFEGKR